MSRALVALATLGLLGTSALPAQTLRDRLNGLFTFGSCGKPLCLDVNNTHGNHFLPAVTAGGTTVIGFVTEALANSAANIPVSATSSGATFTIVDGLPVRTSTSAGPVFAERPQTLGRNRLFIGTNVTNLSFSSLNGVPLDNLGFAFTHSDVGNPGLGDPNYENDVIRTTLALKLNVLVASAFATYGVTDFLDIGFAVPFVRISLDGNSVAQIDPAEYPSPHFFAGTAANPVLRATSSALGTASGIGDVVGRVKLNIAQGNKVGAAILTEVRFPTGDTANFLGSGSASARWQAVVGAQLGNFSLHGNGGYLLRTGKLQNDAVLATLGFDSQLSSRATLAFSLISQWVVGDPKLTLPGPVSFDFPVPHQVQATSIPNRRDDRLDAALGLKYNLRGGSVFVINGSVPLIKSGIQPEFYWTSGIEVSF